MRRIVLAGAVATAVSAWLPDAALAFECPAHFESAKQEIARVSEGLKAAGDKVAAADRALVHALLDDAKMLLAGAEHNHAKPQGKYDHARAIAKADSATAYARAAGMLLERTGG
ncbi:MAG TPA: hypothetical protein ENJ38_07495 [Rhodospirillales bacterium]|nr:hypothetical protein [Rhodospirillales bacterium]